MEARQSRPASILTGGPPYFSEMLKGVELGAVARPGIVPEGDELSSAAVSQRVPVNEPLRRVIGSYMGGLASTAMAGFCTACFSGPHTPLAHAPVSSHSWAACCLLGSQPREGRSGVQRLRFYIAASHRTFSRDIRTGALLDGPLVIAGTISFRRVW